MARRAAWLKVSLLTLTGAAAALAQTPPTPSSVPAQRAPTQRDSISGGGNPLVAGGYIAARGGLIAHLAAIRDTGVGLYYGDKSSFARMDGPGRAAWLQARQKPGTTLGKLTESSCIAWAYECIGKAYERAGRGSVWSGIKSRTFAQQSKGTVLAKELVKDGWVAVYWNPDTKLPNDNQEEHPYTARIVRTKRTYYEIPVKHVVVNYRPTEGSSTEQDGSGLAKLGKVGFWFGIARGGKHTFVGYGTTVSEFHWDVNPDSPRAIEEVPLVRFGWNSGVIVVPPGTWPR